MNKTLPIWRDANRLLLEMEQSVKHFPRYHKYTLGSEFVSFPRSGVGMQLWTLQRPVSLKPQRKKSLWEEAAIR